MKTLQLAQLGMKHVRGHLAARLYSQTGRDLTKPIRFNAVVNERCNLKCRYCDSWRLKSYRTEMSIEQWQQALLDIRNFVGRYAISFTGGEPFTKSGFLDLLAWCGDQGISGGVTTNGSLLSPAVVQELVAARPFNVNISVDTPDAATNDYLRGKTGLFDQISGAIGLLRAERDRQEADFPIVIKPTVNANNFRHLPELVVWTQQIGANCVSIQPMYRWTPETYDELWIEEPDLESLARITEQLIQLKRDGATILNSEASLRAMPSYFREARCATHLCRTPMHNFTVLTNGDVRICSCSEPVGNILEESAEQLWYGQRAQEIRRESLTCDRLVLNTAESPTTLLDKVKMGMTLLKR